MAIVVKFLDDNKPKTSLKKLIRTVSNFDDLIQFYLICQMLRNFLGLNPKLRTVSKVRKRKRQFLRCAGLLRIKVGREIGKFHIAKKRDARVQLLFR